MIANGEVKGEIRIVNMQFAHGFHNEAVEAANPATKVARRSQVRRPELRALVTSARIPLSLRGHAARFEDQAPDVRPPEFREEPRPAGGQCLHADGVRQRRRRFGVVVRRQFGSMHGQKIRVIGSKAKPGMVGRAPESAVVRNSGQTGTGDRTRHGLSAIRMRCTTTASAVVTRRLFEAWSNLYRYAQAMVAKTAAQRAPSATRTSTPAIEGVRWVENCVRSADQGGLWVDYR